MSLKLIVSLGQGQLPSPDFPHNSEGWVARVPSGWQAKILCTSTAQVQHMRMRTPPTEGTEYKYHDLLVSRTILAGVVSLYTVR